MRNGFGKKCMAVAVGAVLLCTALPASGLLSGKAYAAEEGTAAVYANDFESGDVSAFHKRGDDSDLTTISVGTGAAYSGDSYMNVTGREKSWHGPAISLNDICEAGEQYTVSLAVKTPWYATVTLSMEHNGKYDNITNVVSQGDWVTIDAVKFNMPDEPNVSLYLECSDTKVDIAVDDFVIRPAAVKEIQQDIVSLKDYYSGQFKFGTAATANELAPKTTKNLILKHFNSLTPGNELKPDAILDKAACQALAAGGDDTDPQVSLDSARTILDFCRDNNISVRGHVLVWHSQTPDWFFKENYEDGGAWVSKEKMLQRMENYIKNVFAAVAEEYPTVDFYAWDVVNECFLDDGSARNPGEQGSNGSNNSAWVQVFGDNSFIDYAFEYARKYAPAGCKLYYNDFNEYMPGKTQAICDMATRLKEKGLIDGIGMQSHLDVGFPTVSAYEKALAKFAETGLDIQVTELDITTSDTSEAGFAKQAEIYKGIMEACVKYKDNISAVVIWGTTDDMSWRATRCPLLFDGDYMAKDAFYSITDLGLTPVVTTTTTNEPVVTTTTTVTTTEPKDFILGDINGDGKVNGMDLADLRWRLVWMNSIYSEQEGDMNEDGAVTLSDVVLLQKFLLNL